MKKLLILLSIVLLFVVITGCKSAPPEQPVITETPEPTPEPTPHPTLPPTPSPEKPYYIEILPSLADKDYSINPYSFIHSFYSFIFYDFRLTALIPLEERQEIMKTVYDELLLGSQVNFIIKKYLGVDKLSLVFYVTSTRQGMICELKTNWDEGAGVLVPLDMPEEEWKQCVSIFYYIIDQKLIHKENMYSFHKEELYMKNMNYIALAHMFIFDEEKENDTRIEDLLNKIITRNPGNLPGFQAQQELVYYSLLHNQISGASEIIDKTSGRLDDPALADVKQEFMITGEEIEVLSFFE